jgi:hypothetical protein
MGMKRDMSISLRGLEECAVTAARLLPRRSALRRPPWRQAAGSVAQQGVHGSEAAAGAPCPPAEARPGGAADDPAQRRVARHAAAG